MATCAFSTTIKDYQERPLSGVRFFVKVHSGVVSGTFVQPTEFNVETNWRGVVRFPVIQGASVTISANHPSWATPTTITVPSQSAYDLANLADLSAGTIGTSFTVGSVLFVSTDGLLAEDNANFFWDDTANALGLGTATPAASAILDLTSTSRGFLPPRMTTTQKNAVTSPATGLVVYDSTLGALNIYTGSSWGGVGGFADPMTARGDLIYRNSSNVTARLAVGASATFLRSNGTDAAWTAISAGDLPSLSGSYVDLTTGQSIGGAKVFSASVTGPLFDKGGMVHHIKTYGAVCNGSTDDATAFQAAITAAGNRGSVSCYGCGSIAIGSTLTIGNGTGDYTTGAGTTSTINDVTIDLGGSTLIWTGSALGTMFQLNGPIQRVRIINGYINMAGIGALGLDLNHPIQGIFENLEINANTNGYGVRVRAYGAATIGNGAARNIFKNVFVLSTQTGAKGWDIGYTALPTGATLDVCQTEFINCQARFDTGVGTYVSGSIGFNINFADACTFTNPLTAAATGVKFVVPGGATALGTRQKYPSSIQFVNPAITGTTSWAKDETNGAWAAADKIFFAGYQVGDGETLPSDTANTAGFTSSGSYWGVTGLSFSGNARRITGNFDDGTRANRTLFQTTNASSNSYIGVLPTNNDPTNGAISALELYSDPDPDNSVVGSFKSNGKYAFIVDITATGTRAPNISPLELRTNGNLAMTLDAISATPNVVVGTSAALSTSATNGFLYGPTSAGAPTGTPTAYTGKVATEYDTTNDRSYFYNGGWRWTPTTTSETGAGAIVRAIAPILAAATVNGNLTFSGSARRIIGDFSNATPSNLAMFQTSTVDNNTVVAAIPNGSAVVSAFRVYANSDPTNSPYMEFYMNGTFNSAINCGAHGSGTAAPFTVFANSSTQLFQVGTNGHFTAGPGTTGDFAWFTSAGPMALPIATKTAAHTIGDSDSTIFADATGGAFTETLPAASSKNGRIYTIKKVDSSGNAVTVGRTGSDTIDGATTYSLGAQYKYVTVQSDGSSKWYIIANN